MTFRSVAKRVMSWALFTYAVVSLSVALWLLIARWPILATDDPPSRIAIWLCAANITLAALVVPDKAVARSIWPSLFQLRPESVQTIRRAVRFAHLGFWVAAITFAVARLVSPSLVSSSAMESALVACGVCILVCFPLMLGALAAVGRTPHT
jgi:hypothetical protein